MIRALFAVRRGQAMVETSFAFILLFLLTMGIVDFSMATWEWNTVSHLAREGARYGVPPGRTPTQIQNYVVTRAVLPGLSTSNVVVSDRGTCGDVTDPVVVTVDYQYQPVTPMIALLTGPTIGLRASANMYVEQGVVGVDCACGGSCACRW